MNARVALCTRCRLLSGRARHWRSTKGQLRLPEFASLADKASETVTVTLDANLLGMACAVPEQ